MPMALTLKVNYNLGTAFAVYVGIAYEYLTIM